MTCSRRTLLGGFAAALTVGPSWAAAPAQFATPAIDVHHHFLPPFYKPLAKGWMDKFATGVAAVMAWTPEASLAAMDEANVRRAVLSISSPGVHFGDDAQAAYPRHPQPPALPAEPPGPLDVLGELAQTVVARALGRLGRVLGGLVLSGGRGAGLVCHGAVASSGGAVSRNQ